MDERDRIALSDGTGQLGIVKEKEHTLVLTDEGRYSVLWTTLRYLEHQSLEWQYDVVTELDGSIVIYYLCNDLFFWGCSDSEQIRPEDIPDIKQAFKDVDDAEPKMCKWDLGMIAMPLWVSRKRKMRPQGCCYPKQKQLWPLFDACGPERESGAGCSNKRPEGE